MSKFYILWANENELQNKRRPDNYLILFSLVDRRGYVVPDCTTQYLSAKCNPQKTADAENNAVNKVWHESYGATTTTQPQVTMATVST